MAKWDEKLYKIEHSSRLFQFSLFKRTREQFLNEVGVELKILKQWHELNLLSFDPEELEVFDEKEVEEARFIKILMRSGISFEKVTFMLGKLEKPYCYNFNEMFWDFEDEEWISIDSLIQNSCEQYLFEYFDENIDQYISNLIKEKEEEHDFEEVRVFDLGNFLLIKKTKCQNKII